MRSVLRGWGTLVGFFVVFDALVASGSDLLDKALLILVWGAFLIGSVILIIKSVRRPSEPREFYFGQTAWLPVSWRRWILDEKATPQKPEHPRPVGN